MSIKNTKNWSFRNDSRLSMFAPLPSIVFDFGCGGPLIVFGWLFFAVGFKYSCNKEKSL